VFSAADEGGLERISVCYRQYMSELIQQCGEKNLKPLLDSLAYTLCTRRSKLPWRSFILANDLAGLREMKMERIAHAVDHPCLGFIFTGQGAQYAGMAKRLLAQPIIKASLNQSQRFLNQLGCRWSVMGM
jgi:acyl transferase domain-containing protein